MINYDKLRSTAYKGDKTIFKTLGYTIEEVKNLPIKYLRISQDVADLLSCKGFHHQSFASRNFETMGSLVDYGYSALVDYLSRALGADKGLVAMQEIQEALAEFALKLQNTEFTVFDIRTDFLRVSELSHEWIRRNKFETIGDLYIYGTSGFVRTAKDENKGTRIVSEVKEAMKAFGTKPEKVKIHDTEPKKKVQKKEEGTEEEILAKKRKEYFPRMSLCVEAERELREKALNEAIKSEKQKKSMINTSHSVKTVSKNSQPDSSKKTTDSLETSQVRSKPVVTYRVIQNSPSDEPQFVSSEKTEVSPQSPTSKPKIKFKSTAELPIYMLGLRVDAVMRILESLDVKLIGDLTKYSFSDLMKNGFSYERAWRISKSLKFYGLSLREDGIKIESPYSHKNPQLQKKNEERKKQAEELGIQTEGKNAKQIAQQLRILKQDMAKAEELGISVEEYRETKTSSIMAKKREADKAEALEKGITLSELKRQRIRDSWQKRKENKESYVNPNAGAGVARVKPVHFENSTNEQSGDLIETTTQELLTTETETTKKGARKGSKNSNKFYHGEFGYARIGGRVKLFSDKNHQGINESEFGSDDGWQM